MASDLFSNPHFQKYILPTLKGTVVAVTISPPPGGKLDDIRDKVKKWVIASSLKCYFVLEYDQSERAHWHGCISLSRAKKSVEYFMKAEFKKLLDGLAFVDWQTPKNLTAWVNYTCKGVKSHVHTRNISDHCLAMPVKPNFTVNPVWERGEDGEGERTDQLDRSEGEPPTERGCPPCDEERQLENI